MAGEHTMTDQLLASTDIEDALAQAYISALAAKAGYVTAKRDFDRDGVDVTIEAGGHMRPKVDLQLKATINLPDLARQADHVSYHCPRRNYDLLRVPTQTPRLLVVMHLPKSPNDWLTVGPDELTMRYCAYWLSLQDSEELRPDAMGRSVHIPKVNRLDDLSLRDLMDRSRSGKIL